MSNSHRMLFLAVLMLFTLTVAGLEAIGHAEGVIYPADGYAPDGLTRVLFVAMLVSIFASVASGSYAALGCLLGAAVLYAAAKVSVPGVIQLQGLDISYVHALMTASSALSAIGTWLALHGFMGRVYLAESMVPARSGNLGASRLTLVTHSGMIPADASPALLHRGTYEPA